MPELGVIRVEEGAWPAGLRRVSLGKDGEAFPAIAVETASCRAQVALQGAQLLCMETAAGDALDWLSPGARFVTGRAVRGGIPLCFPWFGAHRGNVTLPAHGFARVREWTLVHAAVAADGEASLAFELADDAATRALWPHAFRARLAYTLGASLAVRFRVTNTGDAPCAFGFALHNYLPVTDVARTRIEGLGGLAWTDKLAGNALRSRSADVLRLAGETDRVYHGAGGAYRVVDEVAGITREVTATDCRDAVVWNPWDARAASLGDLPGDAWRSMLCVECGNTGAQDVQLEPGETREWQQRIAILR